MTFLRESLDRYAKKKGASTPIPSICIGLLLPIFKFLSRQQSSHNTKTIARRMTRETPVADSKFQRYRRGGGGKEKWAE